MKPGKVRPIALCVFHYNGQILAARLFDAVKQQVFYRPLGGTIEFGESAAQAVAREIQEELGTEVTALRYLGTLENIFVFNGQKGHEIILVFDGEFEDRALYAMKILQGDEGGVPIEACWIPIEGFEGGPVYPTGLLELVREVL